MTVKTAVAAPDRPTTCRYLNRHENRCTSPVVDEVGEILLCHSHLARALELIRRGMKQTGITTAPKPLPPMSEPGAIRRKK